MTLSSLARMLMSTVGAPVVEQTGLTGEYTFIPEFAALTEGPRPDDTVTFIFVVLQEQLGLKLESIRGAVDVLVIDRAELPSEN